MSMQDDSDSEQGFPQAHSMGLDQEFAQDPTLMNMEDDSEEEEEIRGVLPEFSPLSAQDQNSDGGPKTYLRVSVPPHRLTPLRNEWQHICEPIVTHMKLAIRYNQSIKAIELMVTPDTIQANAIQKAHDFCKAFCLGFEIRDAIALLRLDDLYIDSFELKNVRVVLTDNNSSRAIGRLAGHGGKTKFTIENATKTRIVIADTFIHVLGSYQNIRIAKRALSRLVIGAPPGKIYNQMKNVAARNRQRF